MPGVKQEAFFSFFSPSGLAAFQWTSEERIDPDSTIACRRHNAIFTVAGTAVVQFMPSCAGKTFMEL